MASKNPALNVILPILALAGGIFIGYVDSHSDTPAITLLLLAVLTFVLGSLGPRRAWVWAILAGVGVPALDFALPRMGLAPWDTASPPTIPSCLGIAAVAMAGCFAGAYAGALLGWAVRGASEPRTS